MTEAIFRGQITGLSIKKGIAKLSFETDLETVKIDQIKGLLDKGVDIHIIDNQSTLPLVADD